MKLVLLAQPGDDVASWVPALHDIIRPLTAQPESLRTDLTLTCCEAHDQAPDWTQLQDHDLVIVLEGSTHPTVDWRSMLIQAHQSFQVVVPSASSRLQALLWTLGHHLKRTQGASPWPLRSEMATPWQGTCEKCSDPECEHLLFTRLLAQRTA